MHGKGYNSRCNEKWKTIFNRGWHILVYVNTEMKGLSGGGGITIVVVNRSPTQRTCNVQIDCSGCNNLTSSRDFFVTDDVVRPNSGMIIQMLNILQPNGGFSYSMQTSTRSTQTLPFGLGNSMNLHNVLTGELKSRSTSRRCFMG